MTKYKAIDFRLCSLLPRIERKSFPLKKEDIAYNILVARGHKPSKKMSIVGTWAYSHDGFVVNWAMGVQFPIIINYKSQDYQTYVRMFDHTDSLREEDFEDFASLNRILTSKGR